MFAWQNIPNVTQKGSTQGWGQDHQKDQLMQGMETEPDNSPEFTNVSCIGTAMAWWIALNNANHGTVHGSLRRSHSVTTSRKETPKAATPDDRKICDHKDGACGTNLATVAVHPPKNNLLDELLGWGHCSQVSRKHARLRN